MKQISNIIEGWSSLISGNKNLDPLTLKRAEICSLCPEKKDFQIIEIFIKDSIKQVKGTICGKCKCPLSAKIRSKNEKCPLKKW